MVIYCGGLLGRQRERGREKEGGRCLSLVKEKFHEHKPGCRERLDHSTVIKIAHTRTHKSLVVVWWMWTLHLWLIACDLYSYRITIPDSFFFLLTYSNKSSLLSWLSWFYLIILTVFLIMCLAGTQSINPHRDTRVENKIWAPTENHNTLDFLFLFFAKWNQEHSWPLCVFIIVTTATTKKLSWMRKCLLILN